MEKHAQNCNYLNENEIGCPSNVKNIKIEPMENDEDQLMKLNESQLITADIKQECNTLDDVQLLKSNESMVMNDIVFKEEVNRQIIMCDEIKIETVDHIVFPETKNIDSQDPNTCESATKTIEIKSENETINMKSSIGSQKTKDGRPYKCTNCNYVTKHKGHFRDHMMTHDKLNADKFNCCHCKFSSIHKGNLITHMRIHNNDKPFQCDICQKYFNEKNNFKIHMNKFHPDSCKEKMKVFQCNKCPYNTVNRGNFASHKFKHGDAENLTKHRCSTCEYSTYYKSNLKQHSLRHNGEKRFICNNCEYSTTTKANLKTHIRICHQNTDDRRYKCTQCKYATNHKGYFNLHWVTHNQETVDKYKLRSV